MSLTFPLLNQGEGDTKCGLPAMLRKAMRAGVRLILLFREFSIILRTELEI